MNEHLVEDIIDWNYGEDEKLTPRITWERSSEDSLGTEQLSMLVERGVITMDQETENWVRYRYLLPKKTEPRPEVSLGGPRQPYEQKGQEQGGQSGTVPGTAVTPAPSPAPAKAAGDLGSGAPSHSSPAPSSRRWWRRK
jgi:hypothetical protein